MSTQLTAAQVATGSGHSFVAKLALELVGVALLAIIADTGKAIGNAIVMLFVAFLVLWFIIVGYKYLNAFTVGLGGKPASGKKGTNRPVMI